ncbi:MAG: universal stress protein [Alphaproteobacteria bacterium]
MSIRTILVPTRGTEGSEPAVEAAIAAGRSFGAHVEMLHVSADPRDALPIMGEMVPSAGLIDELLQNAARDIQDCANRARARFDAMLREPGVRRIETRPTPAEIATGHLSLSWRHLAGQAADAVAARGRVFDLIVVERPGGEDVETEMILEGALLRSGRPVLVAPPRAVTTVGSHMVVAWNGSVPAARAVAAAMPFLTRARTVHILVGRPAPRAQPIADDLAATLAWHGISAEIAEFDTAGHVGTAMLDAAGRLGADLLVMGGYGHSQLREMIFGGATIEAVFAADLPLLMTH